MNEKQEIAIGQLSREIKLLTKSLDRATTALGHCHRYSEELWKVLNGLVAVTVNPHDGGEFEDGELPALDAARKALKKGRPVL